MSVNISLLGRLGRDAEIKQVGKTQVAQANVAVNHDRKNDAGEYEADWYRLNVWGDRAEAFCKLFSKGKRVMASGSLEINHYTTQSGEVRETKDVRVTNFEVIDWEMDNAYNHNNQNRSSQSNLIHFLMANKLHRNSQLPILEEIATP